MLRCGAWCKRNRFHSRRLSRANVSGALGPRKRESPDIGNSPVPKTISRAAKEKGTAEAVPFIGAEQAAKLSVSTLTFERRELFGQYPA